MGLMSGWTIDDAQAEEKQLTVDSLGELSTWTPVSIENIDDDVKDKFGRSYSKIKYLTLECKRTFSISYFKKSELIKLFNALKLSKCEDAKEIIGKKLVLRLGKDQNKNGKLFIKIIEYNDESFVPTKAKAPSEIDQLELPKPNKHEEVPF